MPAKIVKLEGKDGFEVVNPVSGVVHAKKTTEKKAKAQKRILDSAAAAAAEAPLAKAEPAMEMKAEGKKAHAWIDHIKGFAAKHGITYSQALKHGDLKKDYKPVEKAPRSPRVKKEKAVAMEGAGVIDQMGNQQAVLGISANAHQMSPNELKPELESLAAAKKIRKPRAKKTAAV